MDSPIVIPGAQTPWPSCAGRRRTSLDTNSPDFEFWMVRNPSFPTPNLLSADKLFVDGVLLPLHLLPQTNSDPPDSNPEPDPDIPEASPPDLGPKISSSSSAAAVDSSTSSLSSSKRWRDIFKKEKKQEDCKDKEREKEKEKEKKRERKSGGGGGGTSSSAELNINIWPFSRSRSAGNACTRPKTVFGASGPARKVNSAPCSRSNSAGESKSRKWPSSPGRPGVHLGRSSPVWQVRRGSRSYEPPVRSVEKGAKKDASGSGRRKPAGSVAGCGGGAGAGGGTVKAKVLNLNVPICMAYRSHLSCRSDENSALGIGNSNSNDDGGGGKNRGVDRGGGGGGHGVGVANVGSRGNIFSLRSLFTKKPTARSSPSESPASYVDLEEIAKKERQRVEELLRIRGIRHGSYPRFTLGIKGQKVTVKFQIPPACEVPQLIANLVSQFGLKVEQRGGGSDMLLRAWDSGVSWQLTLTQPDKRKETGGRFLRRHIWVTCYPRYSWEKLKGGYNTLERKQMPSVDTSVSSLEPMGVRVYGLDEPHLDFFNHEISWENIAGYHQQKGEIEDTILLALQKPEIYDDIARGTRCKFESNRPRAVLFEGPPGTGKTSSARVIATQAGVPMLYVPLEVVMSKYYGECERLLAKVFSLANASLMVLSFS